MIAYPGGHGGHLTIKLSTLRRVVLSEVSWMVIGPATIAEEECGVVSETHFRDVRATTHTSPLHTSDLLGASMVSS